MRIDICSVLSIIYHYPSKQFKGNLETIRGRKQISHSKGGEEETEEGTKKVWPPAFNEEETKICFHLISIQFVSNILVRAAAIPASKTTPVEAEKVTY